MIDGTSGTASDGLAKFTYTNSTARLRPLATGGNMHFYNVGGCAGLFNTGDPVTLSATFTMSSNKRSPVHDADVTACPRWRPDGAGVEPADGPGDSAR